MHTRSQSRPCGLTDLRRRAHTQKRARPNIHAHIDVNAQVYIYMGQVLLGGDPRPCEMIACAQRKAPPCGCVREAHATPLYQSAQRKPPLWMRARSARYTPTLQRAAQALPKPQSQTLAGGHVLEPWQNDGITVCALAFTPVFDSGYSCFMLYFPRPGPCDPILAGIPSVSLIRRGPGCFRSLRLSCKYVPKSLGSLQSGELVCLHRFFVPMVPTYH